MAENKLALTKMHQVVFTSIWVRGRRTINIDIQRPQTQARGHYAGGNVGIRSNRSLHLRNDSL